MSTLLLVDDNDLVRAATAIALSERGYRIVTAANGHEALDAMRAEEPVDAVILDILMPEMDGIETLREMRQSSPGIPIVAISGGFRSGWADALSMAPKFGATSTLSKPFLPRDLIRIVEAVLANEKRG